ncbi:hypothetical protein BD311DRAFT_748076 [Dichomitus squalens]|uniref:Uncharacterized protein n=1 Tax=Dichomitus squalens TaxID=114155 RepID=A0A4Q9N0A4_9APHY|nr:hypothetical protein BD311DRAFT_748076 [Dichomitus squalens]
MARRQHQDVDADASHGPRLGPGPPSTDATNEHAYTFARRTETRNCAAHVVADMRAFPSSVFCLLCSSMDHTRPRLNHASRHGGRSRTASDTGRAIQSVMGPTGDKKSGAWDVITPCVTGSTAGTLQGKVSRQNHLRDSVVKRLDSVSTGGPACKSGSWSSRFSMPQNTGRDPPCQGGRPRAT